MKPYAGTIYRYEMAVECHRWILARPSRSSRRLGLHQHGVRTSCPPIDFLHLLDHPRFFFMRSGLGMMEYLDFFEDVGMEPIMAVWSGKYLLPVFPLLSILYGPCTVTHTRLFPAVLGYSRGGTSEPEGNLAGFIQQAKDQVSEPFPGDEEA